MRSPRRKGIERALAATLAFAALTLASGNLAQAATTTVVKRGDTLQKISDRLYGTTRKWYQIFKLNKEMLGTPDKIEVGQTLTVPDGGNTMTPTEISAERKHRAPEVHAAVEEDGTATEMAADTEIEKAAPLFTLPTPAKRPDLQQRSIASTPSATTDLPPMFSFVDSPAPTSKRMLDKPAKSNEVERFSSFVM